MVGSGLAIEREDGVQNFGHDCDEGARFGGRREDVGIENMYEEDDAARIFALRILERWEVEDFDGDQKVFCIVGESES